MGGSGTGTFWGTCYGDHLLRSAGMCEQENGVCSTAAPAETPRVSVWTMTHFKRNGGENVFVSLHTNVDQNVSFRAHFVLVF